MARSVAFYLTRFDESPAIVEPQLPLVAIVPSQTEEQEEPIHEPLNEHLDEELRQQLRDEGGATVRAELGEMLERERAAFVLRLESERRRWAREEGERLGEAFVSALNEFSISVAEQIERILEPFVIREVREQMLHTLIDTLRALTKNHEHPIVHLSGPPDILEAIRAKLNDQNVSTKIEETSGADILARFDSTTIETRLAEWIDCLREKDTPE